MGTPGRGAAFDPISLSSEKDPLYLAVHLDSLPPARLRLETRMPDIVARLNTELEGSEVKDHYVSAGAHFVPWPELAQQTLDWLDRHLGPVE